MKAKTKSKPFSRLSAAAKRIAIAKDILKQIKAERYTIESGTWLNIDPIKLGEQSNTETQAVLMQRALLGGKQTVTMDAPPATCTCCAVGAACASAIRLFNQDSISGSPQEGYELNGYDEGMSILRKYFPEEQVDLMEAAFEMRTDSDHEDASESSLDKAVCFGKNFGNDEKRLEAICKNIIKNKGTFKP